MDNLSRRPVRMFFSKSGQAVFVSHLDVNRAMQRMLRRAGVPIWYTQGFNPHPYLVFHQPLSVGYTGRGEIMDFYVMEDLDLAQLKDQINDHMPPGFQAQQVCVPVLDLKDIAYAGYTVCVQTPAAEQAALDQALAYFLAADELITEKKSKKGVKLVDIKPLIHSYHLEAGAHESLLVKLTVACSQAQNLNPRTLFTAFAQAYAGSGWSYRVTRTGFYDAQMKKFR